MKIYLLIISLVFISNVIAEFSLRTAYSQIEAPVDLTHDHKSDSVYIASQPGYIYKFNGNDKQTFLDIKARVRYGGELGLLGVAFHKSFDLVPGKNLVYVYYTADGPLRSVISKFQVNIQSGLAEADSETVLLTYNQPYSNHNGGGLVFGVNDDFLYISSGDGGSGGDPENRGQDLTTFLGKILRIDVLGTPDNGKEYAVPPSNPFVSNGNALPEIYAYGLRNPWRISFDSSNGRLWAGDVGQNRFEEVDVIESGGNYGWRVMEGSSCFNPSTNCNKTGLIEPILDYDRTLGNSITGGYVYRAETVPELQGLYVFGDYGSGQIFTIPANSNNVNKPTLTVLMDTPYAITAFGVDKNNDLYVMSYDEGIVYKFDSGPAESTSVSSHLVASVGLLSIALFLAF